MAITWDDTTEIRKKLAARLNEACLCRRDLEEMAGQVWNTDELRRDFEVMAFAAPIIVVKRKADGKIGTLMFQHSPRFYWGFEEDKQ